jgi:DNA-binding response OmpR family regulator
VKPKILIIDDDRVLLETLKDALEEKSYRVVVASSGKDGLRKASKARPDLIILDIMLPGMDGWEVCQRLREISTVPIIMLSARAEIDDVVKGFEIGADDYVAKPFSVPELEARIQAVLRRSGYNGNGDVTRSPFFSDGNLTIDFDRRKVKVGEKRITLTPIEFELLACLVRNAGRVLPHQYLLRQIWGPERDYDVDYIKMYIRYLRCKLEDNPSKPVYIQTEWGEGYYFNGA